MYAIRVVVADDKELTILEQRSSKLEDGEVDDSIVSAKNEANALNKLKVMLYDLSNFEEGWEV